MNAYDPKSTPWRIQESDFPHSGDLKERLAFLIRYAILAPSTRNTQPWRFRITGSEVHIYADLERWQKVADFDRRELHISIGCALENMLIAAEHFGFGHSLAYFPDAQHPELCAIVTLSPEGIPAEFRPPRLFDSIPERVTNHREYWDAPIAAPDLAAIQRACVEEDLHLWLTSETGSKRRVDELVAYSDRVLFGNPAFCEELSHWFGQGVFGTPWLVSVLGSWAVSNLKLGTFRADADKQLLWSAPVLGVLSSERDDNEVHVKCGQAFARICLTAAGLGIAIHPFSQIVQVGEARTKLAHMLPVANLHPLQPFRLGHADPETKHTPRRPIEEVLQQHGPSRLPAS